LKYCSEECERVIIKKKRDDNADQVRLYYRNYKLRDRYGIDQQEYDRMFIEQDGKCKGCGTTKPGPGRIKYFHVDHDHTSGKIRGLLCSDCNLKDVLATV
jgi:hypothetical protein